MSQENVEVVRRGYELFAAGDVQGVAALVAEGAELADVGGLGIGGTAAGTRYGPEGFVRASEDTQEAFEDYSVEPQEFHGYDLGKDVEAGGSVEFDVPATIEGVFEVELESRAEQLASITVNP
jgi:ketosteroid isomerase-like protein